MKGKKGEGHVSKRFIIRSEGDFIQNTLRNATYSSLAEFNKKVIEVMNADKPRTYYLLSEPGQKYLHVKCSICKKFQLWFVYKKVNGALTEIKYDRSINLGHLKEKHNPSEYQSSPRRAP